jgi:hypothetical protein
MVHRIHRHNGTIGRASRLPAAALALAIGAISFAPTANAGGESDVIWGIYKLRAQECAQPVTTAHGCLGGAGAVVARPATPSPSPAALPATLRANRHQFPPQ